jgi:lytic murein transglycosylase
MALFSLSGIIMFRHFTLAAALGAALSSHVTAQTCGGDFGQFVRDLKVEAQGIGVPQSTVDGFFASVRQDPAVIRADRAQGVFQRDFIDFSRRLISQDRIDNGRRLSQQYDSVFARIEAESGVPRGVLLAFWAFETDYGQIQGDFNTVNALVTLAHDCRRPELFRPQVLAAIRLYSQGGIDPARTTGAWAGEIGQVQMLPADIVEHGTDGDGDGRIDLKGSAPDALVSGGRMLRGLGWQPGQPWLEEVILPPTLDWSITGLDRTLPSQEWTALGVQGRNGAITPNLPTSILLPMGRNGPAFLAYPNFSVLFEWNQSLVYVTTAAYFATRLMGAPVYNAGNPEPGLSGEQMIQLQQRLAARGHDVGRVDGILGSRTRAAVQAEQTRLGLPADAWPTVALLNAL